MLCGSWILKKSAFVFNLDLDSKYEVGRKKAIFLVQSKFDMASGLSTILLIIVIYFLIHLFYSTRLYFDRRIWI